MATVEDMLFDTLQYFCVGEEMVHLVHAAAILLVLLMVGVLIVVIAVFLALLHNHTDTAHVVMVCHHGR